MTDGMTMTNPVIECILSRRTAKYYDPAASWCESAPPRRHPPTCRTGGFIAVRTPEAKARLRPIAWDQPAITEAAVTFIVCGQLADLVAKGQTRKS
jgi:nitroreductase